MALDDVRVEPNEIEKSGDYDLEGLFVHLSAMEASVPACVVSKSYVRSSKPLIRHAGSPRSVAPTYPVERAMTEYEIEVLAYSLWEARGRPDGSSQEDWLNAEAELHRHASEQSIVDESSKESFPSSDAPGSHLPDEPPSNSDAKWAASAAAQAKPDNSC